MAPRLDIILSDKVTHASERSAGSCRNGQDVTSVGGRRRCRRRPRSWEDVSYLFGGEVRAGRLKEALNELTTTLLLLPGPGRIRPTTRSLYRMKPEGRPFVPLLPAPAPRRFSLCLRPFARSYGEEKPYDRGHDEGKAEKEEKEEERRKGHRRRISLDLTLMPGRGFN